MTTAVYFDLDGTLLEYTASFDALARRVLPVEATDAMLDTYSEAVLAGLTEQADRPYERAFETVAADHGLDLDAAALADAYVDAEVGATYVPPAVLELVETAAARHDVGILTNGDGRMQRRKLAAHGLAERVDTVLVSNEVGVRKPDTRIFALARERLPAATHVYVGDTYAEDIVPAREAGFETVYVGDDPNVETPVRATDTAHLASLLVPLLDSDAHVDADPA